MRQARLLEIADGFAGRFIRSIDVRAVCRCAAVSPLPWSSLAFAADALARRFEAGAPRLVLVTLPGIPDSERAADDMRIIAAETGTRVYEFPPPAPDEPSVCGERIRTLAAIGRWSDIPHPCIVAASNAAVEAAAGSGARELLSLAPGFEGFARLCDTLSGSGYSRAPFVSAQGEWSARGGIIDFWSPGAEYPDRCEFDGDAIEDIREFDAATQKSVRRAPSAAILPARESESGAQDGAGGIIDLLPGNAVILAAGFGSYEFDSKGRFTVYAGGVAPSNAPAVDFPVAALPGFLEFGASQARHPEIFELATRRLENHIAALSAKGAEIVRIDSLSGGFEIPGLAVVSKADRTFVRRRARVSARAKSAAAAGISDFEELVPGEPVVHLHYGIGLYCGSSEIVENGRRREVFTIEYAGGAKLHVPATHVHLVTRYSGPAGADPELNSLDGKKWAKDKADAQKAAEEFAEALLETQARRAAVKGFDCDISPPGMDAFEAAFPYEETEDQAKAIEDVKRDLAAARPMDRLVCGDAGYGKTEVAMRAAYIAAMNGRQTAVLAPTAVLAEQHYESFVSRFDGTPVSIESLSRLVKPGVRAGIVRRIASGVCDIVIGTHAILSKSIRFANLGLIVIDEEQRFGVRHKEILKRLKSDAEVLTLSATPIPRTLYLSLTGTRDLSVLKTPPGDRVSTEISVTRDSDAAVVAAVGRELERGGQVFFLHNRVATIDQAERRIRRLFPDARVIAAHGRLDSDELSARMRAFQAGEADILVSTTIVESGIDIPRANTIIVERADTFGLADLYQLRGRVGRSSRKGYALFLLPAQGPVDDTASERLDTLRRHGAPGGGFNLAMRDLEFRGAGNLLGAAQSGHAAAVGFTLYCRLLRRAVARLKGETPPPATEATLNFDFIDSSYSSDSDPDSARIPGGYIEDEAQRLEMLAKTASAADFAAVRAVAKEMRDRFGPPPPPVRNLLATAFAKSMCARCGISRIDVKNGFATFRDAAGAAISEGTVVKGPPAKMLAGVLGLLHRGFSGRIWRRRCTTRATRPPP